MAKGFGHRLRTLREAKGLTQAEVAKRAGLHRVYITMLEAGTKGNPSLTTIQRLARALRLPVVKLLP